MRELSKSVGNFSIALSFFGMQQAVGWLRDGARGKLPQSSNSLETVAHSAEDQLGGYFRNAFEAGDRVQRSAVDLAFGFVDGSALNPRRALDLSTDVLRQSVAAVTSLVPGTGATRGGTPRDRSEGCKTDSEPCGWGPMPPAR